MPAHGRDRHAAIITEIAKASGLPLPVDVQITDSKNSIVMEYVGKGGKVKHVLDIVDGELEGMPDDCSALVYPLQAGGHD
jgi:tRNA A-37 threonylcarbamoyl transferase component Bud32